MNFTFNCAINKKKILEGSRYEGIFSFQFDRGVNVIRLYYQYFS